MHRRATDFHHDEKLKNEVQSAIRHFENERMICLDSVLMAMIKVITFNLKSSREPSVRQQIEMLN